MTIAEFDRFSAAWRSTPDHIIRELADYMTGQPLRAPTAGMVAHLLRIGRSLGLDIHDTTPWPSVATAISAALAMTQPNQGDDSPEIMIDGQRFVCYRPSEVSTFGELVEVMAISDQPDPTSEGYTAYICRLLAAFCRLEGESVLDIDINARADMFRQIPMRDAMRLLFFSRLG